MYLVTDHHDPIIDRDTYNRVQQELARRSSKRKISDKTKTEQGNTAVNMHLRNCLSAENAARLTAVQRGLQEGKVNSLAVYKPAGTRQRYCPDSPTIKEEQLHKAIVRAINNYYSCGNGVEKILKANISNVLECHGQEEITAIEKGLKRSTRQEVI